MAFRISHMLNYRFMVIFLLAAISLGVFVVTPSFARTVTDQLERTVTVPDEPRRIVSLAPNITEIIFALGQEHRLMGATRYSDFPPEANKLPKVGSYVHLDLEKIVALKPDLCIAIKDGNPIAVAKRLESLKIPVYAVNPKNLETIMQTVLEIGGLINAEKEADLLVQNMDLRIQKIKSLVSNVAHRPRVFFQIGVSPIVSVGTHTFIHGLIVLAGGTNLAEGSISYPRFSREQVLALSPEVIIITSMAREAVFEQVKAEWNKWPDLPAVRNQRIFLEDSNFFDRPTPRLVDGLELLVRLIHPELFKEAE
jgi:iron complex transport system substrate-binding protein